MSASGGDYHRARYCSIRSSFLTYLRRRGGGGIPAATCAKVFAVSACCRLSGSIPSHNNLDQLFRRHDSTWNFNLVCAFVGCKVVDVPHLLWNGSDGKPLHVKVLCVYGSNTALCCGCDAALNLDDLDDNRKTSHREYHTDGVILGAASSFSSLYITGV